MVDDSPSAGAVGDAQTTGPDPPPAAPRGTDGDNEPADQQTPATPVVPRVPPPPGSKRAPAPAQAAAPAQDAARPARRRSSRLQRIVTLLLIILAGAAIGVMLWLVVPPLFDRFVDPLAENNAAVARLERQMEELRNEQRGDLLEQRNALLQAQEESNMRFAQAEQRLADAEARLRAAEDAISAQGERDADPERLLADTTAQLDAAAAQLETLQGDLPGVAEGLTEFNYQLMLIRAWQDTLKARLRLFENNAGLAEEDLTRAIETLQATRAAATPEQQAALDPVIARMQEALAAVRESPFTASADLEVAWYALGELIQPVSIAPAEGEAAPVEGETTGTPAPEPAPGA